MMVMVGMSLIIGHFNQGFIGGKQQQQPFVYFQNSSIELFCSIKKKTKKH